MEVMPSRRIHIWASGLCCFAICSIGPHMSEINVPIAIQLTAMNFKGLFRSAEASRRGLKGLSLAGDAANSTQGSVITSTGKAIHLDSGTQMVLRVVN
jgi:hypothetical protein